MKFSSMQVLWRLVLISLLLSSHSLFVVGQTARPKDAPETADRSSVMRTNADETFELNIDERRFARENFEASTAVGTDGEAGLNLQIGVALAASRIGVLLRNVRGSVRFHGSLNRILEMINNRATTSPGPPIK
ncbi:MAG: hypothetical protein ABR556_01580 [Pyrinomonadaceae bacterium]